MIVCLEIEKFLCCVHRSTSANRSLPDIPKDKEKRHENTDASVSQDIYEITETIGDHSELYATVQDTGIFNNKLIFIFKYFKFLKLFY